MAWLKFDYFLIFGLIYNMSASSATQKTVYLIRHAQSTHNEFALTWKEGEPWVDPMFVDARVSKLGQTQIEHLREKANQELIDIELIVVSPLSRALITCSLGLEHYIKEKKVPVLVNPLCREKVENGCDLGRPPTFLRHDFPSFDFSMLSDVWWYTSNFECTPDNYVDIFKTHRYEEPEDHLEERIAAFKSWLLERPESTICVVGHSAYFSRLCGVFLQNCQIHRINL